MLRTILLLCISNLFMTIAWYGHLKFDKKPLWLVIIASWAIAFFEYCFQVPANRFGYESGISPAQLKTIQEVITLTIFIFFAWIYLGETPKWNVLVGFLLILAGATLIFKPWAHASPLNP